MYKAEWGNKRTCPKCATRFYDLGNDSPIVCIDCAHTWTHEPALKEKQSSVVAQPKAEVAKAPVKAAVDDEDIAVTDDDDIELDDDSDDDDVLGDISLDDDDEDVAVVIETSVAKPEDE